MILFCIIFLFLFSMFTSTCECWVGVYSFIVEKGDERRKNEVKKKENDDDDDDNDTVHV